MGRMPGSIPTYLEVDGKFISKPLNIDNYFNYYFYVKLNTLWTIMAHIGNSVSSKLIKDLIMTNKNCELNIKKVTMSSLCFFIQGSPPGVGNFDAEFLCIAANSIGSPVYHIFNLCIEKGIFPQNWKLPKLCNYQRTVPPLSLGRIANRLVCYLLQVKQWRDYV